MKIIKSKAYLVILFLIVGLILIPNLIELSYSNIANYMISKEDYNGAEKIYKQLISLTKLSPYYLGQDSIWISLSELYNKEGSYPESEKAILKAISIRKNEPFYLKKLAQIYAIQGKYVEAEKLFKQNIAYAKKKSVKNANAYSESLFDLGVLYTEMCRYKESEELLTQAAKVLQNNKHINNTELSAAIFLSQGVNYQLIGKYLDAENCFKKSISLLGKKDQSLIYFNFLGFLGSLYIDMKEYKKAEIIFNNIISKLKNTAKDKIMIAYSYNALGFLHQDKHEYSKAEYYYNQALKNLNYKSAIATISNNLGMLYLNKKKYSQAKIQFNKSINIFKNSNSNVYLACSIYNQSLLDQKTSNIKEYEKNKNLYLSILKKSFGNKNEKSYEENLRTQCNIMMKGEY